MRGRKPKPAELAILEGNPGKRQLPQPVVIGGRPTPEELAEPPAEVELDSDARNFWVLTVPRLARAGVVDLVDIPALAALATQYARMIQARRVVASEGHFAKGSMGQLVEHPALKIERNATKAFQSLSEQFGITPVARVRLGKAELERQSLADALGDSIPQSDDLVPVDADNVVDADVVEVT